ncbi:MAG: hypothetical protein ABIH72_02755 [archaeon]
MNDKASSTVVVNILLILIVTSMIFLVGTIISKISKNQILLSPEDSCLDFQLSSEVTIKNLCINESSNKLIVTLERKATNQNIKSLDFIISSGTESLKWSCKSSCNSCKVLDFGTKNYYLNLEGINANSLSLAINNCPTETKEIKSC